MAPARETEADARKRRGPICQQLNQAPFLQVVGNVPLGHVGKPIPCQDRLADQADLIQREPAGCVPFGGMKQSDLGRENGTFGLEAYLEPKTLRGMRAA
jgi:hypothetical protein